MSLCLLSYRALLEILKDEHISPEQASDALSFALTQRCATQEIFNAYLEAYARHGDVDSVERGMDVMKSRGLEHNAETYAAILEAYSRAGDIYGLKRVFDEVCASQGTLSAEPCAVMITHFARNELGASLRTGYDKEKGGKGEEQIRKLIYVMRKQGVDLTQGAYNALLELYMRTRNLTKLLRTWDEMKVHGAPRNIYSYNMVLEGLRYCAEAEMENSAKTATMEKFMEIAKEMQEDEKARPDTHTFNTLFLANKMYPDESSSPVAAILNEIVAVSLAKPTRFTYNSLIHQYAREQNFEKISETITKMMQDGINLDRVTYVSLLKISALQGPDAILKV